MKDAKKNTQKDTKKVTYKPKKGGFNLDERKMLNPYGNKLNKNGGKK